MCGIAALFRIAGAGPLVESIRRMTDTVAHRGPDGEGFAIWTPDGICSIRFGGRDTHPATFADDMPWRPERGIPDADLPVLAALGHRRLAIVDLSPRGHQPMITDDGLAAIVFNGEIYNHEALRAELELLGSEFRSHTDTEVILHAWRHWGIKALERFNGMFSIVIYEPATGQVFFARDRFGVKPAYFWVSPAGFIAFASEIKQFTVLPGWKARLNAQRAYDYLNFGLTDHTRETLFADVLQLRGGEYLRCNISELDNPERHIRRWYTLTPAHVEGDFEAACGQFSDLFTDAVNLRLHADVPVGMGLSGGLDSSSIVCTAHRLGKHARGGQHTFSACAADARFDERRHVETVVSHCGTEAHFTYPELGDFIDRMKEVIWHHDEPLGGGSVFAEWEVFRMVATTPVKVTLDGLGADEELAGYHDFFKARFASLFGGGQWLALLREARAVRKRHGYALPFVLRGLADVYLPDAVGQVLRRAIGKQVARVDWMEMDALGIEAQNIFRHHGGAASDVRALSTSQLLATSLPMQLRWCDRDSMAHGIESRAPFLDYRLVEFVLGCPDEFKVRDGVTKRILRHAMKGTVPVAILERNDKMGFVTPEFAWIREQEPGRFVAMAAEAASWAAGIVNLKAADKAKDIIEGRVPFDHFVWRLICFAQWLEIFDVAQETWNPAGQPSE